MSGTGAPAGTQREWAPGRTLLQGSGPSNTRSGSHCQRFTRGRRGPEQQQTAGLLGGAGPTCGRKAVLNLQLSDTHCSPEYDSQTPPEPRGYQSLTLQCESAPAGSFSPPFAARAKGRRSLDYREEVGANSPPGAFGGRV